MPRLLRKILIRISVFCLCMYCLLTGTLLVLGWTAPLEKADVAVILGTTVEGNGEPSERLQARLNRGLELYQQQLTSSIIVSGGFGKEGYDEAQVMRHFLVQKGVPFAHIIVDSQGNNTARTAQFTAQWLQAQKASSAIVVSQFFHIPRTRLALNRLGVAKTYGAYPDYYEWRDFFSVNRELFANVAYFFGLTADSKDLL